VIRTSNAAEAHPVPDAVDPAITRFLDGAWMERGLSSNTLAAYRADLMAL
jgi:integrase/recombinase XerD